MTDRDVFDSARRALSTPHERNSSLCDPFLDVLPITGAAVSVLAGPVGQSTICSSNSIAARLDEIQFDLGEGPCWQALATRRPVLANDFAGAEHPAWPMFAQAVRDDSVREDIGAVYAFPLTVGALEIGAVDLYALHPRRLTSEEVSDASALAEVASWQVLRQILADQESGIDTRTDRTSRREVHQATGMVLVQLNISADDAALLLRAHAFSSGRSVLEIANDVVERRLSFIAEEQS